ncbi:MAG: hypothetical protein AB8B59_12475 [Maribacter sp.]
MTFSNQRTSLFFRLSISITVFGALLNIISWPLILLGVAGMVIFHTIQLFQKQDKSILDYSRHFLIVSFSCNYVFDIFHLPYTDLFNILTKTALIVFLILFVKKIITLQQENTKNGLLLQSLGTENLSYILADLATVYIVIASLIKILHWEFGILSANILLIIGLFTALISILTSSKSLTN